ncbi:MAG TPA: TatD family hydrolase [Phycisphaerales bacterium]|nr:TatD family hydrolase [Phycisphaerales bacterium]
MIDTHCHLTFRDFAGRVPDEIAEGARHGVTGFISVSTTTRDCLDALTLARAHPNVWCTAGVHPLHAHEGPHEWENLRAVALDPARRCVAWGELGLDNHYQHPPTATQRLVLDEQLRFILGSGIDLPIVIHCREAFDDLIPVLRSSGLPGERFVFHCFTGGPAEARAVLDFGGMISFTGVVTYRNAQDVQAAARLVPPDRLMVETDAPFLSPEPHRGKRPCRPAWVRHVAEHLAHVRGEQFARLHERLNANTASFFGIGTEAAPAHR